MTNKQIKKTLIYQKEILNINWNLFKWNFIKSIFGLLRIRRRNNEIECKINFYEKRLKILEKNPEKIFNN